ncbi:hypothetical protein Patl1_36716 [Pistacia atlantica]|nr:hypothetical protein Patl1_36716 [Pistacia atlantica]
MEKSHTTKTEDSTPTEAHQFISATASCIEKESVNEQYQTGGLRETKDLSQTIGLLRKYLHAKAQPNLGKINKEESEAIKRKSPPVGHPLVPPLFGCNFARCPSFLEQKLLPAVGGDPTEANSAEAKSSKEQLTIFYGCTVHVEAIMLLAGESNLSKQKPESKTPVNYSIFNQFAKKMKKKKKKNDNIQLINVETFQLQEGCHFNIFLKNVVKGKFIHLNFRISRNNNSNM